MLPSASVSRIRALSPPSVTLAQAAVTPLPPPRADPLPSFPHTDKRAFFIICTSELGPPQIYELVALTSSDKNM